MRWRTRFEAAIRKGEFEADAPVEDIVVQLVSIANSAGPITQDAGDFERLAELYRAFLRTVEAAYAQQPNPPPGRR